MDTKVFKIRGKSTKFGENQQNSRKINKNQQKMPAGENWWHFLFLFYFFIVWESGAYLSVRVRERSLFPSRSIFLGRFDRLTLSFGVNCLAFSELKIEKNSCSHYSSNASENSTQNWEEFSLTLLSKVPRVHIVWCSACDWTLFNSEIARRKPNNMYSRDFRE